MIFSQLAAMEKYSAADLLNFKKAQKLAYNAVEVVRGRLYPGISEKEAADMVNQYLADQEVTHYFHRAFAWFGERTRFKNFSRPLKLNNMDDLQALWDNAFDPGLPHFGQQFAPREDIKLQDGMAVILDVAPCVNGCAADIGYSFAFGNNDMVTRAKEDLKRIRSMILQAVLAEKTGSQIYLELNLLLKEMKYENIHSYYPGEVLGHKVGKLPFQGLPAVNILGFDLQAFAYLGIQKLLATRNLEDFLFDTNPLWGPDYSKRPEPGLWAIEPHIGRSDFGVKFEELLVITENNAYWLDDDLPHTK